MSYNFLHDVNHNLHWQFPPFLCVLIWFLSQSRFSLFPFQRVIFFICCFLLFFALLSWLATITGYLYNMHHIYPSWCYVASSVHHLICTEYYYMDFTPIVLFFLFTRLCLCFYNNISKPFHTFLFFFVEEIVRRF